MKNKNKKCMSPQLVLFNIGLFREMGGEEHKTLGRSYAEIFILRKSMGLLISFTFYRIISLKKY